MEKPAGGVACLRVALPRVCAALLAGGLLHAIMIPVLIEFGPSSHRKPAAAKQSESTMSAVSSPASEPLHLFRVQAVSHVPPFAPVARRSIAGRFREA